MNVNGIGGSPLSAVSNATTSHTAKTRSSIPPANGASASTNISKPAELLQKLQQLQQQDPTQFKQVVSQLADSLQQVADKSGDSNSMAARLATALKKVADTGDLSSLQSAMQPPGMAAAVQSANAATGTAAPSSAQAAQKHHHGHHHGGGGGAVAAAFSTAFSQIDAALKGNTASSNTTTNAVTPSTSS
jgi:hypothetical protein